MYTGESEVRVKELKTSMIWSDLEGEPGDVTKEKIEIAREIGVPALFFTNTQAESRVNELAEIERQRQLNRGDEEILYLALQHGGSWLANLLYGQIVRAADGVLFEDTYGIKLPGFSRVLPEKVTITKELHEDTQIRDKHVTFIDTAVRKGTTLQYLAEHFADPSWTIYNAKGGTPRSISAITMTARENSISEDFPIDISTGCITPEGVRTAGCGSNDNGNRLRHDGAISMALYQEKGTEEQVAAALEQLGERAVMGMDDIQFVDSIR